MISSRAGEVTREELLEFLLRGPAEDYPAEARHGVVLRIRFSYGALDVLQSWCVDARSADCLTARYEIRPPVFGSLISAFLSDIQSLSDIPTLRAQTSVKPGEYWHTSMFGPLLESETKGVLAWPVRSRWPARIRGGLLHGALSDSRSPTKAFRGNIDPQWLETFLDDLAEETSLGTRMRLVLLCECQSFFDSDRDEWASATESLLKRLPAGVAVVLGGGPESFTFPEHRNFRELDVLPESRPTSARFKYALGALHSDRPATADALGVELYAEALARLVLLPETTPVTIGVHGRWGKGKSSLMRFVETALIRWSPVNREPTSKYGASVVRHYPKPPRFRLHRYFQTGPDEWTAWRGVSRTAKLGGLDMTLKWRAADGDSSQPTDVGERRKLSELISRLSNWRERRRFSSYAHARARLWKGMRRSALDDVVPVWFNAWRYQGSIETWAGLAAIVTEELERALPRWRRIVTPLVYAWRKRRAELIVDLVLPLLAGIFVVTLFLAGVDNAYFDELPSWIPSQSVPAAATALLAGWFVASRTRRVIRPVSDHMLDYLRRPDRRAQMGYQHLVLEDIRFVHDRLRSARPRCRVVIFIDDLDRCSSEKVVEVLQAINLILGESEFFVFLGIDTMMIHRAIEQVYGAGHATLPPNFALDYLRKIIQLPFHLPPSTKEDRNRFVSELFSYGA